MQMPDQWSRSANRLHNFPSYSNTGILSTNSLTISDPRFQKPCPHMRYSDPKITVIELQEAYSPS